MLFTIDICEVCKSNICYFYTQRAVWCFISNK